MQNMNKSALASNIRRSNNCPLIENQSFFWLAETFWSADIRLASTDGLAAPAENRDRAELSVEFMGALPLLAGQGKTRPSPCGQSKL